MLFDSNVKSQKRNARNPDPGTTPTKDNILDSLRWLVKDAFPGDVLFFFYSGLGLLVDDACGYENEGFEEAIIPSDVETPPQVDTFSCSVLSTYSVLCV